MLRNSSDSKWWTTTQSNGLNVGQGSWRPGHRDIAKMIALCAKWDILRIAGLRIFSKIGTEILWILL